MNGWIGGRVDGWIGGWVDELLVRESEKYFTKPP